jgi:CheY-like chemotaxis protein
MNALRKVLYIEDDVDIREVAKMALELVGGLELCVCESGSDAVKNGPAFAPDLILLDVMMPGMDGPTTLAKLRESPVLARTPAVFMTAKVQPLEVAALRALGALAVIAKPFDPMQLAKQVAAIYEVGLGK